jgi:hypothetical protein
LGPAEFEKLSGGSLRLSSQQNAPGQSSRELNSQNAQLWDDRCRSYAVIGETPNLLRLRNRTASNDAVMDKHDWIALGLDTFFSLSLGCHWVQANGSDVLQ